MGIWNKVWKVGSKKVYPTISSVKPNLKKTVSETKLTEFRKRYKKLDDAEKKVETGKKLMKEGQKTRKDMAETGTAFKFKHSKSYHAVAPGDKAKYKIKKGIAGGD